MNSTQYRAMAFTTETSYLVRIKAATYHVEIGAIRPPYRLDIEAPLTILVNVYGTDNAFDLLRQELQWYGLDVTILESDPAKNFQQWAVSRMGDRR